MRKNCRTRISDRIKGTWLNGKCFSPFPLLIANYADEIHACPDIFPKVLEWARRLRSGGVKPLLVMHTLPALMDDGRRNSGADIWVMHPLFWEANENHINKVLQKGEKVWSYNAGVQDGYSPKWTIDFSPINFRIQPGFISQSLNLYGISYWIFDNWTDDPWNVLTKTSAALPGEGQFVYPGRQVGIRGVAPGIRLKWLREGIEDYEYMQILKSLGKSDFVRNLAEQIGADWRNWTRSTIELYSARRKPGKEIQRVSASPP